MARIDKNFIEWIRQQISQWTRYSTEEHDEILSRTLVRLAQNGGVNAPKRWSLSVAKNVGLELIREQSRARDSLVELSSHTVFTSKIELNMSPAWRRLPSKHRELFRLVYVDGQPVSVAARTLNVKRSTAKSWLDRDKAKLRQDATLRALAGVILENTDPRRN